jgi:hypothetical protein
MFGILVKRDRAIQLQRSSQVLIVSLANYIREWATLKKKLPPLLEVASWRDACGDPIKYQILASNKFSLISNCGGREQKLVYEIEGDQLKQLSEESR